MSVFADVACSDEVYLAQRSNKTGANINNTEDREMRTPRQAMNHSRIATIQECENRNETLRKQILNFLAWNDRNGNWIDEDMINEGFEVHDLRAAVHALVVQLED